MAQFYLLMAILLIIALTMPLVRVMWLRRSKYDVVERFRAICEHEPALLPLHAIRFRSAVTDVEFAETVADFQSDWARDGMYLGMAEVLGAFVAIYGRDISAMDVSEFLDELQPPPQTPESPHVESPAKLVRDAIWKDPDGCQLLDRHKFLRRLDGEANNWIRQGKLKNLGKALATLTEESKQEVPKNLPHDLFEFCSEMDRLTDEFGEAAQSLDKPRKAEMSKRKSSLGPQAKQKRQRLDAESYRKGYDQLTAVARHMRRLSKSSILGVAEFQLVARAAETWAELIVRKATDLEADEGVALEFEQRPPTRDSSHRIVTRRILHRVGRLLLPATVLILIVVIGLWSIGSYRRSASEPRKSVVKVTHASGHGTGFLVDRARRLFVTSEHVVTDNRTGKPFPNLRVTFEADDDNPTWPLSFKAQVVGSASKKDLAILQAFGVAGENALPNPLRLSNADDIATQTVVTVIGHPDDKDFSELTGRVTSYDRAKSIYYIDGFNDAGCSGAPVLHDGEVVGVVFAMSGELILQTHVIPAKFVLELLDQSRRNASSVNRRQTINTR